MLLATGIGHIIVIKGEYYLGIKCWSLFLIVGLACITVSLVVHSPFLSGSLGIIGVTFLWGIGELFKQKERVKKGWFPENKNRKH
ncbi:hypothetical protein CLORY_27870 [Clostridium oryzae]|uniref:DUF4491 domain-containing protein n=2 Tax=Clostridium oryzae TaxID=1450648 RepID=A0A1V4IKB4_9CLOT|nr:hypothetical protein CLORY_27870 [Clostridium oryzae]